MCTECVCNSEISKIQLNDERTAVNRKRTWSPCITTRKQSLEVLKQDDKDNKKTALLLKGKSCTFSALINKIGQQNSFSRFPAIMWGQYRTETCSGEDVRVT